jgi:hypothetical protein
MAREANKSILRGIIFYGLCPLLAILGGLFTSDTFVLDTAAHPAKWEYPLGYILLFSGIAIFIGFLIYANKGGTSKR